MVETRTPLDAARIDALRRAIRGEIIGPDHGTYDDSRRLWNAIHDLRPALIVRPTDAEEVATAVRFALDQDLEIAIRSGAHSAVGHSSCDGGLVIDVSAMRGAWPSTRVAVWRARTAARSSGELDVAAQHHGLVCPVGVVGHTGVAGLTLGGGIGRLQRNFGLTIDSLRAVEIVTADGRLVRASAAEEPELFWGLRGAGWNFGVATAFEFDLHPFGPMLHRGVAMYPASQVHDVWSTFRDAARTLPDTVSVILGISMAGPTSDHPDAPAGGPIVVVAYNHSGDAGAVERDTAPLRAGPRPVSSTTTSEPYLDVQTAHDLVLGWGRRSFIKGLYADDIRPGALDALVAHVASGPPEASVSITMQGGAISRIAEDATAFSGRAARFDVSPDVTWDDPAEDEPRRAWVREAMAIVEPDAVLGRYANENADVGPAETLAIYGAAKLERLTALKRAWDQGNVFHRNTNVSP